MVLKTVLREVENIKSQVSFLMFNTKIFIFCKLLLPYPNDLERCVFDAST